MNSIFLFFKKNISFLLVAFLGAVFSYIAFVVIQKQTHNGLMVEFEWAAQNRHRAVQKGIEEGIEAVRGIHRLFLSSDNVNRSEFKIFAQSIFAHNQHIQALEWVPRVYASQRLNYEKEAKAHFPGFQFTEHSPKGEMVRASEREVYYPIYYMEPYEANKIAMGFDLSSNPVRLAAIKKARDSGKIVVSSRITMLQGSSQHYGFLVLQPIYHNGFPSSTISERRRNLIGFAVGVFRIRDVAENAIKQLAPRGVDFLLRDSRAKKDESFLYFHSSRKRHSKLSVDVAIEEWQRWKNPQITETISVGDQQWEFVSTKTAHFRSGQELKNLHILASALVILLTILLLLYLNRQQRHIAELQAAEKKITSSKEKILHLYHAVEQSPTSVIITDTKGDIEYINPKFTEVTGYSHQEVIGKNPRILKAGRTSAKDYQIMWETITSGREWRGEFFNKKKNGELFWELVSISPIKNSLGVITHYLSIKEDITKRKQIEKQINNALEFQTIISHLLQAVINPQTINEILDHALELVLSIPGFAIEGRGSIFMWDGESGQMQLNCYRNLPDHIVADYNQNIANNSKIWHSSISQQLHFMEHKKHNFDGICSSLPPHKHYFVPILFGRQLLGLISIYLPINYQRDPEEDGFLLIIANILAKAIEHNKADENLSNHRYHLEQLVETRTAELDKNQKRLTSAVEAIGDGFALFDEDDRLVLSNSYFKKMYHGFEDIIKEGVSYEKIVRTGIEHGHYADGKNLSKGDQEGWIKQRLSKHLNSDEVFDELLSDGRWIRIQERSTPDGGRVGVRVDITELKQIQEELLQSQKEAVSANQAKSTFLANMSHELRSPMNSIIGFNRRIKKKVSNSDLEPKLKENLLEYSNFVASSSERLLGLLNNLLDLSKLEAGHSPFHIQWHNMGDIVATVCRETDSLLDEKGQQFRVIGKESDAKVMCDIGMIIQVLVNLVSNAIKFSPENSYISILIEKDENGIIEESWPIPAILVKVKDQGAGIPPDELKSIFKKFVQSSNTKNSAGGTGLGLAISQEIMLRHDGTIKAENNINEAGTTFTIALPCRNHQEETG
ncbi:MAG: CHASE domain-containing protein [Magnetococcales bacterium]|nr:CHASE domain-containing protein [Magnetococcales bacterium]